MTIDAIGCWKDIARQIRKKRSDYVLALKKNLGTLHEDVEKYFGNPALRAGCAYHKVVDKARGAVEVREYRQTRDIGWLAQRKEWAGLSSIVTTGNTIAKKSGETASQTRYFISSLPLEVERAGRAIRWHWMV